MQNAWCQSLTNTGRWLCYPVDVSLREGSKTPRAKVRGGACRGFQGKPAFLLRT